MTGTNTLLIKLLCKANTTQRLKCKTTTTTTTKTEEKHYLLSRSSFRGRKPFAGVKTNKKDDTYKCPRLLRRRNVPSAIVVRLLFRSLL